MTGFRKIRVFTLGFALICFVLPFVAVSCNQQTVASLTGLQLAFGTTVQQPQMFGPPKAQQVDGEPLAIIALLCVLVALGVSFGKSKTGGTVVTILSALGFVVLLALRSRLEDEVRQHAGGFLQVNYEAGFYLALILLVASTGVGIYALSAKESAHVFASEGRRNDTFCTKCGAKNTSGDVFCRECGTRFA